MNGGQSDDEECMRIQTFITAVALLSISESVSAEGRVFSGEYEYGEKYTSVHVDPEEADNARDDEAFDRYTFDKSWLQYDHVLSKPLRISIRGQRLDRQYVSRPELDNATHQASIRLTVEPNEKWAIWPTISFRDRNYDLRPLDNQIWDAAVTARIRWGIRNNLRFGVSYMNAEYDVETNRDRSNGSAFASLEKPITEATTIRIGARVEETDFSIQSASRENSTSASGSVGFRHEF